MKLGAVATREGQRSRGLGRNGVWRAACLKCVVRGELCSEWKEQAVDGTVEEGSEARGWWCKAEGRGFDTMRRRWSSCLCLSQDTAGQGEVRAGQGHGSNGQATPRAVSDDDGNDGNNRFEAGGLGLDFVELRAEKLES